MLAGMWRWSLLLACALAACTDTSAPPDGSVADGFIEDGTIGRRDAGCGPVSVPTDPECVMDTCTGGLTCVGGPCPYVCCAAGRLETCEHLEGYECNVPQPMDCGGGTCVGAGMVCPSA